MSYAIIIILVTVWFCLFLLLGQNIATILFGAGLIGIIMIVGPDVLNGLVGQDIFYSASTYSLSIIPLYLLMAQLLLKGGVIEDLFAVGYRLSGRRRYPLGAATIVCGGLLGAVSGSGAAASAALATLAAPQLEQFGYTRRFSVSLAAISGSLAAVIPPSIIIIVYGSLTLIPIGHLFIGSFGPGALCIIVYIICLKFFGETQPGAVDGAANPEEDIHIGKGSIPSFIFVVVLMVVIFGSIYGGVATAAEAGAVGAFVTMVGMAALRRIGWRDLMESLASSATITSMIMAIVLGAQVMGRFLSFSRLPRELLDAVVPLLAYPSILIALMLLVFFICGMFLEATAIMVLVIPMLMPILEKLGVNLLWFGVMACFVLSIGLLTPPVGTAVYAASTASGLSVDQVFRKTFLFGAIAAIIVCIAMVFIPGIVTWLPSHIK